MDDAIWLFFALAQWYFPTIFSPLSAGYLTLIPAIGVVSLVFGVVLGIRARRRSLLLFGLLALASHVYVAIAGFFRGSLPGSDSHPLLLAFLLVEVVISCYLVYRLKGVRIPAIFLAIFTSSYAGMACFIAAMSFTNDWL